MAKGDKININLQKLEGSMEGIMNQMGLGVNVAQGGSLGMPKKTVKKSLKKSTKPGNDSRSLNDSKSSAAIDIIGIKKGDEKKKTSDGKIQVETHPTKKKEDSATANLSDVHRRKP
jgi:hypothetical protein